ncbi:c-type cytochrome [Polaribacter glomeratus]|uniref:Cytochrome c domain-containing protein n=1 Tax=Polaribacter glomeratus TaxID=102 RepID=A0A2S7WUY5_9FLAO|nr:hypothetical protein [Polaribacter glomeratus]PQJ81387.1 hypothetical protein BTO16_01800 [Polaribacter glomeratus]TXD64814.1 cytochrome c [Polaribacter glomeratus]
MKNNFRFRNHFLLLLVTILFTACLTNVEEPLDEKPINNDLCETVSYSLTIKPIIDANCIQCHSTNGGQFPNLNSYAALSSKANSVLSEVQSRRMPIGGTLTTDEIAAIKCWVNSGALNN